MQKFGLLRFGVAGGVHIDPWIRWGLQCKAIFSLRLWVSTRLRAAYGVMFGDLD